MDYRTQKQARLIEKITEKINSKLTVKKFTVNDVLNKLQGAFFTWGVKNADFIAFLKELTLLEVEVVTDADEFAHIVTMFNSTLSHSWGGGSIKEVEEHCIILDSFTKPLRVGENSRVVYSAKEKTTTVYSPNFDTEEEYCILLSDYTSYSEYDNHYEDDRTYSIYVYSPLG